MNNGIYDQLQLREIFHLEFLRWLGRKLKPEKYVLKGGSNLRFFFNSMRYSEDMDLDVKGVAVDMLKDIVMKILNNRSFQEGFIAFGIVTMVAPDMRKAKQTETTQRFKVHLMTRSGEDLFTKVEFSRRSFKGKSSVQSVLPGALRPYKLSSLLIPHYDLESAIMQKIDALVTRRICQPRDIFDIYMLSSLYDPGSKRVGLTREKVKQASRNIITVGFKQFRDTVLCYLMPDDRTIYDSENAWDEIKLKTVDFVESLRK